MKGRSGPFWDAVEGRAPLPPAAATLGAEFIDADVEAGTIELAFAATKAFTNPGGQCARGIPGGDAVRHGGAGAAGDAGARPVSDYPGASRELPAALRPGRIVGRGRVVRRDGDMVFLEASLSDPGGTVTAVATATARVIALASAPDAA
jgi:acyl-coenzyme A thioesterase PaaI-like protein